MPGPVTKERYTMFGMAEFTEEQEETLDQLADYLRLAIACRGCDNTNRHILAWMNASHVERLPIPHWYCDCEVLLNFLWLPDVDAGDWTVSPYGQRSALKVVHSMGGA